MANTMCGLPGTIWRYGCSVSNAAVRLVLKCVSSIVFRSQWQSVTKCTGYRSISALSVNFACWFTNVDIGEPQNTCHHCANSEPLSETTVSQSSPAGSNSELPTNKNCHIGLWLKSRRSFWTHNVGMLYHYPWSHCGCHFNNLKTINAHGAAVVTVL